MLKRLFTLNLKFDLFFTFLANLTFLGLLSEKMTFFALFGFCFTLQAFFSDLKALWKDKNVNFDILFCQECVLWFERYKAWYKALHSLPYRGYNVSLRAKCMDKSCIQPSIYWKIDPTIDLFCLFLTFFYLLTLCFG